MIKKAFLIFLFVNSLILTAKAQEIIHIGVFHMKNTNDLVIESQAKLQVSNYKKLPVTSIAENDFLKIKVETGKLRMEKNNASLGLFDTIYIKPDSTLISFKVNGQKQKHPFCGSFKIYVSRNYLKVINSISLEKYIIGVVAAESGYRATDEYYKVQAIIARTYALFNKGKHKKDGFDLCDNTDCQVYHGVIENNKIEKSVIATKSLVVTDSLGQIIAATYHSNSGGQTMDAEDVWGVDFPYLKSVEDKFSLNYKYVEWEKSIDSAEWIDYFDRYEPLHKIDSTSIAGLLNFKQLTRKPYIEDSLKVPLTKVRSDFGLKSTFFSVLHDGEKIILKGKGFGHGVGLSQIGAMEMAKIGFTYEEIIGYYYHNVSIKDCHEATLPL